MPGHRLAAGVLDVHVEIGVRALPEDARQRAFQIHALAAIELDGKPVVRSGGTRHAEQTRYRDGNAGKPDSHRLPLR